MASIDAVLARIDANQPGAQERLFELLAIPSISTDPAYAPQCERAADWLAAELNGLGFTASVRPTAGRPMVVGHTKAARRDAPHVLFYGHYDVQPVDPLSLWNSDPFKPELQEGPNGPRIVGRGASDDKGQLMTFVEACRAFKETGGLPCDVTVLFEGEEETGSPSLPAFIAAEGDVLKADLALVCDTGMWDAATPSITTMLRGLVLEEIVIKGADRDLHSGGYGGAAVNPIHVVSRIIADLHDAEGRVALSGSTTASTNSRRTSPSSGARCRSTPTISCATSAFRSRSAKRIAASSRRSGRGRPATSTESWAATPVRVRRPCFRPRQAPRVSFRLVGRQDPAKVADAFRAFVRERLPRDCKVEFLSHGASPALQLAFSSEALTRARRALHAEWGKDAVMSGAGGSIPIVGVFKKDLRMDTLMIGFALDDDRIHSPNEKYELNSFHKGARSWARVLDALAK